MNLKISITIICFLIGIVMMWLFFTSFSTSYENNSNQTESVNLALRQVAHNLYNINKDSSSTIPPVNHISDNQFSLELNKNIHYDTLPFLINKAFLDYEISSKYKVTIKDCFTEDIILGYNYLAFENEKIACVGRDHNSQCSIVGVSFEQNKSKNYVYLVLSSLFFLGGFGSLLRVNSKNISSSKTSPTKNVLEKRFIHLGNSYFSPESLTVKVNNHIKTLTFRESKLLEYFFSRPKQVLNRDDIKRHVWEDEGVIVGRSVDVFVSRLRKILKDDSDLEIKNVHGVGYRLEVK